MSDLSVLSALTSPVAQPLNLNADKLLRPMPSSSTENSKIDKASKDFESILLSQWLQQAEQSFGSLPGSDDEDDMDSGKEQFQGIAMQSLGASLASSGGIGIAKIIANSLHKAEDARVEQEAMTHPPPAK